MKVREIMTRTPTCCSARTPLEQVARMMVGQDCGEIPVLDDAGRPLGVVTDRDIVTRTIGRGVDPFTVEAGDCMSSPCVTVREEDDVHGAVELIETHMIRRVVVVNGDGVCTGIVSQADIAQNADTETTAEMLREVSRPVASGAEFI